ncbi:hypothetical protein [Acinetobacter rudis]|uniref:DOMON-like domain-containing protein n=1 Tax=Acinetobacter rudis TaxID=632955 RepID=A0AAW8J7Y6_9GAMM|nr:hypothetical protein [Acinetobacter rudis]MDQ8934675.1 hypothetical protein [Acinetobacter rudis]MDQ8951560.1 hypothetical protein [Acinetobacter rudis]MDQ9016755.1 hypothetical protein [Acinetobacter rudis]
MASYELVAFDRTFRAVSIVTALEQQANNVLNLGFWLNDPEQRVVWPPLVTAHPRQDSLWENTCFEVFLGVQGRDEYREVNLSASQAWQAYQFEEYRFPEQSPPPVAYDIDLLSLNKTHYGLNAKIDLSAWLNAENIRWDELYVGLSAVIVTQQQLHYFAMQHSAKQADFHNKHDWLHQF